MRRMTAVLAMAAACILIAPGCARDSEPFIYYEIPDGTAQNAPPSPSPSRHPGAAAQPEQAAQGAEFMEETVMIMDMLGAIATGGFTPFDTGSGIIETAPMDGGFIEMLRTETGLVLGISVFVEWDRDMRLAIKGAPEWDFMQPSGSGLPAQGGITGEPQDGLKPEILPSAISEDEYMEYAGPRLDALKRFAAVAMGREMTEEESEMLGYAALRALASPEPVPVEFGGWKDHMGYESGCIYIAI